MPSSRYVFGTLPWYSVLILLGICLALLWCGREEKRLCLPQDTTVDLALMVIPLGIIGARLYYVAFAWESFAARPVSILEVWNGGLAIYGGILGGTLAVALYAWRKKIPMPVLTDMILPGVALAQSVGRWGNFFNMEAYGLPVTDPARQFFPLAVLIPGLGGDVWHMATFFYESVWDLLVFLTLVCLRRRTARRGDVTLWYALLYGSGRMVIEGLRMDSLLTTGGTFRVSQLLSITAASIALLIFALRRVQAWRSREIGLPTLLAPAVFLALAVAVGMWLRPWILRSIGDVPPDTLFSIYCAACGIMLGAWLYRPLRPDTV